MEINYVLVGMHINTLRTEKNLTVDALAEMADVTPQHMSTVLNGKAKLSLKLLVNICNALNTTPDYVLCGNIHANQLPHLLEDVQRVYTDATPDEIRHMLAVSSAIKQSMRVSTNT